MENKCESHVSRGEVCSFVSRNEVFYPINHIQPGETDSAMNQDFASFDPELK